MAMVDMRLKPGGPKVGSHLVPCWIHCANRVNSRNDSAMMTAQ